MDPSGVAEISRWSERSADHRKPDVAQRPTLEGSQKTSEGVIWHPSRVR